MPKLIPIGAFSELKSGEVKVFSLYPGARGIAIRKGDQVYAYMNRCTHMGGSLSQCKNNRLICDHHHAEFDLETGEAMAGQAPSGSFLTKLETMLKDDGIMYALVDLPVDPFA